MLSYFTITGDRILPLLQIQLRLIFILTRSAPPVAPFRSLPTRCPLSADPLQQHGRRLIIRVLRHQLPLKRAANSSSDRIVSLLSNASARASTCAWRTSRILVAAASLGPSIHVESSGQAAEFLQTSPWHMCRW